MRLARTQVDGRARWAEVDGDRLFLVDDVWSPVRVRTGEALPLDGAVLLAPAEPLTVVGMAHNTGAADRELPPQAFLKPARSVVGPGAAVTVPAGIGRVDAEAELAVVLGRTARHLTEADALDSVLGYTLANDVTARDRQASDPLWTTAKCGDGWTPLGPWLETDLDPSDVRIGLGIGVRALGETSTANLARGVVEVLVHLTSVMTLGPGDVVLVGAPGEFGPVRPGDDVTVTSPALGALRNPVVAEQRDRLPVGAAS